MTWCRNHQPYIFCLAAECSFRNPLFHNALGKKLNETVLFKGGGRGGVGEVCIFMSTHKSTNAGSGTIFQESELIPCPAPQAPPKNLNWGGGEGSRSIVALECNLKHCGKCRHWGNVQIELNPLLALMLRKTGQKGGEKGVWINPHFAWVGFGWVGHEGKSWGGGASEEQVTSSCISKSRRESQHTGNKQRPYNLTWGF